MKAIVSALFALTVLTGVAGRASAAPYYYDDDPTFQAQQPDQDWHKNF